MPGRGAALENLDDDHASAAAWARVREGGRPCEGHSTAADEPDLRLPRWQRAVRSVCPHHQTDHGASSKPRFRLCSREHEPAHENARTRLPGRQDPASAHTDSTSEPIGQRLNVIINNTVSVRSEHGREVLRRAKETCVETRRRSNALPSKRRITRPYLLSKDQVFRSCPPVGWS